MSARTLFPCAPFNPNAVAAAKESENQSTHITRWLRLYPPQDSDLPSLDAALPSPPLMSTMEHQLESPTAEATKDEGHEVKSESGSDVVMSPTWGVLLISPRRGPVDTRISPTPLQTTTPPGQPSAGKVSSLPCATTRSRMWTSLPQLNDLKAVVGQINCLLAAGRTKFKYSPSIVPMA